jgi:Calx-beta domain/WD40-like Beta Propeller Repeat
VDRIKQLMSSLLSDARPGRVQPTRRALHWLRACCLLLLVLAAVPGAASAAQGDLDLVSRAAGAAGAKANARSDSPAISADGRFVAFHSQAANLDPADNDMTGDVFVRDLQTNSITLASRATGATGVKGNANSSDATISADGRFVAFESGSSNLGAGGATFSDAYVRDLQANTTTLVDRASGADGAPANAFSSDAAISANRRFVAFTSLASNLSPDDRAEVDDVYVRDLQTNTTTLVSRASGASGAAGDSDSQAAAISADGRFVAFSSFASNLDPADQTGEEDIFVRDLQTNTTTLVSRSSGANGAKANSTIADAPAIAADGRSVAFSSNATNLDPADNDTTIDVFVRNLQTNTTTLASRASGAAGAKGNDLSQTPEISGDGRYVSFTSFATNLDTNDNPFTSDVFVRDLQQNTTTVVSRAAGAADFLFDGNGAHSAISADGRFVAFDSSSSNLLPDDPDHTLDVYRRDVLGAADQASRISINDASLVEGDSGQTAFRLTVSLDQAQPAPVTVDFATADGTATAPSDYTATNGTLTFAPGETAKTVTVQVNGDTAVEPDETFAVNLTNATGNATIADATGVGTIVNDDQPVIAAPSRISIGDVAMAEGNAGQSAFRFTVSLDQAQSAPVAVDFATANGTATAPSDYTAKTGTLSFAPGETAKTVTVQVNGDTRKEPTETFSVNLSNAGGNATIADGHAVGTITNDDGRHPGHRFTLGQAHADRKTGTARLAVTVPGPGGLSISGRSVKAAEARTVRVAGTVQLLIRASRAKLRTLNRTGSATVQATVTYTPIGGTPRTRSKDVRLGTR